MSQKFEIVSSYSPAGDQPKAIEKLVQGIEAGLAHQTLLGVTGSGKTYTIANVISQVKRPTIVMVHNKTLAAQLYGEFKEFFPNNAVEYFVSYYDYYQPEAYVAASDTFIEKDASTNEHIEQMRLSATKALLEREDVIIVATVSAIYGLGDPQSYLKMMLHLDRGDHIDQRDVLRRLAELQYNRNDLVLERGNFRVRGDVIEVFPADSEDTAIRIELFDDVVETLSMIDPLTKKGIRKVPRVTIYPKNHYVTPKETVQRAIERIKVELEHRLEQLKSLNKLVELQRLEQRTRYDLEMMQELGYCSGIENYSRYLSDRKEGSPPPTLFDYLPDNALLVIDESHVTVPQIGAMYRGDRSRKESLVEYGFRLPSALDNRPMRFEEWEQIKPQTIFVSATPGEYEETHQDGVVEQIVRPTGLVDPILEVRPINIQVDDLLSEINKRVPIGERVLVTTLTKRMAENLTDYLSDHGVRVRYLHSDIDIVERVEIIRDLRLGKFSVLVGINLLREGLDIPEVSLVAILDADKEGFLRSERALVQTVGRSARNVNGKAILYADHITGSIKRAMSEMNRRRITQEIYNKEHGILPRGITKSVEDILEGAYNPGLGKGRGKQTKNTIETVKNYQVENMEDVVQVRKIMVQLQKDMIVASEELKFELAASYRNQIRQLQKKLKNVGEG